jgi:hypothetical protein
LTYCRKRPELLRPVAAGLQAGSAHRQLARTLGCAPSTVTRISEHLGRHRTRESPQPTSRAQRIAFGRRLNAIVERLFLAAIWRNFVKDVSERKNDPTTPAMRLGLTDRPWKWERVLGRRLFPDRQELDRISLELYRRVFTY